MDPAIWGPKTWDMLFVAALRLEPCDVVPIIDLYSECLPCVHCRRSLKQYRREMPCEVMTDSSDRMFMWVWATRDKVNEKLQKQPLTLDRAKRRYEAFSSYVSCMDVVDVLTCMACCAQKEENNDGLAKLAQCMPEVRTLFETNAVIGGKAVAEAVPCISPTSAPGRIVDQVLRFRRAARESLGLPKETRAQALLRFPTATESPSPPPPKRKSQSAPPVRRPRRRGDKIFSPPQW